MSTLAVHCPCGTVELRLDGDPVGQVFCHCDDCQRAHSAAIGGTGQLVGW